jgi:hypothetical protein
MKEPKQKMKKMKKKNVKVDDESMKLPKLKQPNINCCFFPVPEKTLKLDQKIEILDSDKKHQENAMSNTIEQKKENPKMMKVPKKKMKRGRKYKYKMIKALKISFREILINMIRHDRNIVKQNEKRMKELEKEIKDVHSWKTETFREKMEMNMALSELNIKKKEIDKFSSLDKFDQNVLPYIEKIIQEKENDEDDQTSLNCYKNQFHNTLYGVKFDHEQTNTCMNCRSCNIITDDVESTITCEDCGLIRTNLVSDGTCLSYGDDIEYTSFAYKRINHLVEFLNRLQAKESSLVPDSTLSSIMRYLHVHMKKDQSEDISYNDVYNAVKKLKLNQYYSQIMQIWTRITNHQPLHIDPIVQDMFKLLFKKMKQPFQKHCPPERKNFLSYPYVVYKFSQMLGCEEICDYLSILKGMEKLNFAEKMFQRICEDLGWPWIPINRH